MKGKNKYQQKMSDSITLLDVCKLPDAQIHSKAALFKYLIGRETAEMQKLRDNIVKLSYTNKIIGVKGDEVGIISKRLPLKFKEDKEQKKDNIVNQIFVEDIGYISHKNFFVQPLQTVRKSQTQSALKSKKLDMMFATHAKMEINNLHQNYHILNIESSNNKQLLGNTPTTKGLKSRSQSTTKLKGFAKKQTIQDFKIKRKYQPKSRHSCQNVKSFSKLLKDIKLHQTNRNISISPLHHEQNTLYKRFQRLSDRQPNRHNSDDSSVEILMEADK